MMERDLNEDAPVIMLLVFLGTMIGLVIVNFKMLS
jgi:hypothetical protein